MTEDEQREFEQGAETPDHLVGGPPVESGYTDVEDAPDEEPVSTIDEMKAALVAHHKAVSDKLADARRRKAELAETVNSVLAEKRRLKAALAEEIRQLVAEEAEAARLVRASQPRKPRAK